MSYKFDPENPFKDERKRANSARKTETEEGMKIEHYFSSPGVHPFEEIEWEMRSAKISSDSGMLN